MEIIAEQFARIASFLPRQRGSMAARSASMSWSGAHLLVAALALLFWSGQGIAAKQDLHGITLGMTFDQVVDALYRQHPAMGLVPPSAEGDNKGIVGPALREVDILKQFMKRFPKVKMTRFPKNLDDEATQAFRAGILTVYSATCLADRIARRVEAGCIHSGAFYFTRPDGETYYMDVKFMEDFPARPGVSVLKSVLFRHSYRSLAFDLQRTVAEQYGLSADGTGRIVVPLGAASVQFVHRPQVLPKPDYSIEIRLDNAVVDARTMAAQQALDKARAAEQRPPF
jgi:hypothetical protein